MTQLTDVFLNTIEPSISDTISSLIQLSGGNCTTMKCAHYFRALSNWIKLFDIQHSMKGVSNSKCLTRCMGLKIRSHIKK